MTTTMRPSRAALLLSLASATMGLASFSSACSKSAANAPGDDDAGAEDAAPADVLQPPPIDRTKSETDLAPQRSACAFKAGAWPAETIGKEYPVGADIPINHVIVIMQENRSFDHYLGRLVAQGYYKAGDFHEAGEDGGTRGDGFNHSDQLDGPPAGWSNPDSDGTPVVPHPDDQYCYGVDHSWEGQHNDYDNGKLDNFVKQNNPGGSRTFFYEDDTVIPFYYALANTFSVGDRYFGSVLGPTWPNRYFLMAATSYGIGDNSFAVNDKEATPAAHIFGLLNAAGRTWKDYTDGPHMVAFFPYFGFQPDTRSHYGDVKCNLLSDIANNTLPDVSFVMGDEVSETSDEGPSALPGIGGQVSETIVRTLFASPAWKDTVVFITYDENGGIADHVPPAPACESDGIAAHDTNNKPLAGKFDTTGFRVPFIVVSPYAKAHYVTHTVFDHAAITRFIETRFGLPALSGRDANANPMMDMFDFKNPPFKDPPNIDKKTVVPPEILTKCNQQLAPLTCNR